MSQCCDDRIEHLIEERKRDAVVCLVSIEARDRAATALVRMGPPGNLCCGECVSFNVLLGQEGGVDATEDRRYDVVECHLKRFVDDAQCGVREGDRPM